MLPAMMWPFSYCASPNKACANGLATFHICRLSERSNRLLMTCCYIGYPSIGAASKAPAVLALQINPGLHDLTVVFRPGFRTQEWVACCIGGAFEGVDLLGERQQCGSSRFRNEPNRTENAIEQSCRLSSGKRNSPTS